jgi:hypothetical protein
MSAKTYIKLDSVRGVVTVMRGDERRVYRNVKVSSIVRVRRLPGMAYHGNGMWFGEYHPWS